MILFINKRILNNKKATIVKLMVRLCIIAITLSFIVMWGGMGIIKGFQESLQERFIIFAGQFVIKPYQIDNNSLTISNNYFDAQGNIQTILHNKPQYVQCYPFLSANLILKSRQEILGVIAQGISEDFLKHNLSTFIQNQSATFTLHDKNAIIISKNIANQLNVKVNDSIKILALHDNLNQPQIKTCIIKAIYQTNMEEIDKFVIFLDLGFVRKLMRNNTALSSYQINCLPSLKDSTQNWLNQNLPLDFKIIEFKNVFPQLIDWLNVQNLNKAVLISIMCIVAFVNIITCILVLLVDRLKMISIFKYLGIKTSQLFKLFLLQIFYILSWGIGLGIIITLGLSYLQNKYHFIKLDPENYYISYPEIRLSIHSGLIIIALLVVVSIIAVGLPILFIKKLFPVVGLKRA
ncbi:MAG: hypothetical protein QM539_08230 [Alphaproteobacteria bacterium]|nr:hypothetical protein [Alphaproteobacteria bacterium]